MSICFFLIEMIPPPKSTANVSNCGGTITGVGGIIVSPGYPFYFPKDVECIWLLRVDYNKKIYVRILKMQLYGSIGNNKNPLLHVRFF